MTSTTATPAAFDIRATISKNRLLGLWRMAKGYRLTYLGATIAIGLAATCKTLTFLLLRYFVDNILARGVFDQTLVLVALGFLGLALVEGGCTFLSGWLASRTAEGITRRLRNFMFDHIQRLSYAYHAETPTGELIQRSTSDVDAVRRFYSDQAINSGRILLLFTINFIAILNLSVKLALLSIIIMPIIVVVSAWFFKRISKAYEAFQEQEAVLSTTLQENLSGIRVVKAFARQVFEKDKFEKDNREKFVRGRRLTMMHSLFWPVSDTVCGAQMLGGFFAAAIMAINGEISVGTYMAYAGLVVYLIFPMRNLGRMIVQMSTGLVSYNRVLEVLKQQQEDLVTGEVDPAQPIRGDVRFENVGFEYEAGTPVLRDVSFQCHHGQIVALLGSTGSGKSTLVNLLPRFYDVTGGRILLDERDLRDYPRHFLRRLIGIVEQEPFLFSRSIRDNITYSVDRVVSDDEVIAAARAAAIHDVILSFPEGYKTLVGEKGVTLSGGQKQRLAIARTLLKNPRILILDDSTSSVDTETEAVIREALERLMQNRTTFIIAHRIQTIMTADLILVFDRGQIVQAGTHAALMNEAEGIYRQIYDIQTRIEAELEKEIASA